MKYKKKTWKSTLTLEKLWWCCINRIHNMIFSNIMFFLFFFVRTQEKNQSQILFDIANTFRLCTFKCFYSFRLRWVFFGYTLLFATKLLAKGKTKSNLYQKKWQTKRKRKKMLRKQIKWFGKWLQATSYQL